jgi:hypothetical protein
VEDQFAEAAQGGVGAEGLVRAVPLYGPHPRQLLQTWAVREEERREGAMAQVRAVVRRHEAGQVVVGVGVGGGGRGDVRHQGGQRLGGPYDVPGGDAAVAEVVDG